MFYQQRLIITRKKFQIPTLKRWKIIDLGIEFTKETTLTVNSSNWLSVFIIELFVPRSSLCGLTIKAMADV